jgi:(S)-ureidoglycine aminohydrolase
MFQIRQVLKSNYAIIIPKDAAYTSIPGWENARVRVLASPRMGAQFVEYLIDLDEKGVIKVPVKKRPEYVFYVLEGRGVLDKEGEEYSLELGSYGYLPPSTAWSISGTKKDPLTFLMVKKTYEPIGNKLPEFIIGLDKNTPEQANEESPGRASKNFVPYTEDILYDLSWFILYFEPGVGMSHAENHLHEHGLYMLSGESLYLLDDTWYQTIPGDFIWMAPYVPQSCQWYGDKRGAYLLYSNRNRDPSI